jgi:hypothetical protein
MVVHVWPNEPYVVLERTVRSAVFCEEEATSNVNRGAVVPTPTEPVVTRELVYIVDAELMLETDTRELTVSVENEPVPVPGALLLIEETVRVEMASVVPSIVLPLRVDTITVGAVMVLPVRVDKVRLTAAELRRAR